MIKGVFNDSLSELLLIKFAKSVLFIYTPSPPPLLLEETLLLLVYWLLLLLELDEEVVFVPVLV